MQLARKDQPLHQAPPAYDDLIAHDRSRADQQYQSRVSRSQKDKEMQYIRAVQKFDNPLARDKDWSVRPEDFGLHEIPENDFLLRIKQKFKSESPEHQNGGLPSFTRNPLNNPNFVQKHIFDAISIPSQHRTSKFVGNGFASYYEGEVMATHDVSPADWCRFIEDITAAGKINLPGNLTSRSVPMAAQIGLPGVFITRLIEARMKDGTEPFVDEVLETWRDKFFKPRGLDVFIDKGDAVSSGASSSSSSSSSSCWSSNSSVNLRAYDTLNIRDLRQRQSEIKRQKIHDSIQAESLDDSERIHLVIIPL